ncbi:iron chaperone [Spirosoma fluminis]
MTPTQPTTIDEYIAGFTPDIQVLLQQIRATIRSAAPDAAETISYAMPTFTLNGNLVHFAAFKHHIGFYSIPTGIDAFKEELAHYKSGKGSVQFPTNQPMPLDLIARAVKYRVAQNSAQVKAQKQIPSIK